MTISAAAKWTISVWKPVRRSLGSVVDAPLPSTEGGYDGVTDAVDRTVFDRRRIALTMPISMHAPTKPATRYPSQPPIETPMSPNTKLATTAPMMPRMMFTITLVSLFMTIEAIQPANPPMMMAAIHPMPLLDAGGASVAGVGAAAVDGGELGDGSGAGRVAGAVGAWAATTGAVGAVAVECRDVTVSPGACRAADVEGVVGAVAVERGHCFPGAGRVAEVEGVVGAVAVECREVTVSPGAGRSPRWRA